MCREPLCPLEVLPLAMKCYASHQRELPLLRSSYRLMRRAKSLHPTSVVPISDGLCRLLSVPADRWPFPTLSPQSLHSCLDPYPVVSFSVHLPVPSRKASASPQGRKARHTKRTLRCNFNRGSYFGAAVIL